MLFTPREEFYFTSLQNIEKQKQVRAGFISWGGKRELFQQKKFLIKPEQRFGVLGLINYTQEKSERRRFEGGASLLNSTKCWIERFDWLNKGKGAGYKSSR